MQEAHFKNIFSSLKSFLSMQTKQLILQWHGLQMQIFFSFYWMH